MPKICNHIQIGDVISLNAEECAVLGDIPRGKYVVEEAGDHGGWRVQVRKLDTVGNYRADNLSVQFHQCPGYAHSLLSIKVIGRMRRIFV